MDDGPLSSGIHGEVTRRIFGINCSYSMGAPVFSSSDQSLRAYLHSVGEHEFFNISLVSRVNCMTRIADTGTNRYGGMTFVDKAAHDIVCSTTCTALETALLTIGMMLTIYCLPRE